MYPLYRIQKVWVFNGMGHKMIKTQQTGSIYLHFTPKSGKNNQMDCNSDNNFTFKTFKFCKRVPSSPKSVNIVSSSHFSACNCHALGTAKAACDQVTGECVCKPGYSGKNCQVCPDKTMADQTSCSSRSGH